MAGVTLSSFRWFQGKLLIKSPQGSLEVIKIRLIMLRILEQKNVPIYFRVRWNTFGNPLYCRHQWNQIYPTPASVCSRRTCGPADTCKIRKKLLFFAYQLLLTRLGHFTSALCVSSEGTNSALCCHIPELPPWMFYSSLKNFLMFCLLLFASQYQKGILVTSSKWSIMWSILLAGKAITFVFLMQLSRH